MENTDEAIQAFKKLSSQGRTYAIRNLILDGTVNYIEVTKAYIDLLEKLREIEARKTYKSSMWLEQVWNKIPAHKKFQKAASAYAIIQSGVIHTAPIEKKYLQYLKDNPYEEDGSGFPKTELK